MFRIPKIPSTEIKKVNKLKYPSEDASVSLGREKKAITSREGGILEEKWMWDRGALPETVPPGYLSHIHLQTLLWMPRSAY